MDRYIFFSVPDMDNMIIFSRLVKWDSTYLPKDYPLVTSQFAIENDHGKLVDSSIKGDVP